MKDWIRSLQKWMELDVFREKAINNPGHSQQHDLAGNIHPWRNDANNPSHIRSFSVDSTLSVSSIAESLHIVGVPGLKNTTERPPPLHLGILKSYSAEVSPTRSFESYLPSPAESDAFSHDDVPINPFQVDYHEPRLHIRNESYSGGVRNTNHIELRGKKSMPDLRTANTLNFEESDFTEEEFPADILDGDQDNEEFVIPSHASHQQDSRLTAGSDSFPSMSFTWVFNLALP